MVTIIKLDTDEEEKTVSFSDDGGCDRDHVTINFLNRGRTVNEYLIVNVNDIRQALEKLER